MKFPNLSSPTLALEQSRRVTFNPVPEVSLIENTKPRKLFDMAAQLYETFSGEQVTDDMLVKAAELFNENYGVWGKCSNKAGKPVKLSVRRLRQQYLPPTTDEARSFYIRVTINGNLVGNAFACRWKCKGSTVCWITQLVVDKDHRDKGLASGLLRTLREDFDDIYGVMSSHPAACLAAARSFAMTIEKISLDFIRENADSIMSTSPIPYIRDAELCGTLFNSDDANGIVSGVNTNFFVDHKEPLDALELVQKLWQWPLGDLPDGYEYLLIMPAKQRRSRSKSADVGRQ
ncbi:hypothetical protein N7510_005190 [Penicillium lagena]|uniref:uncharacterized protein n=1 Tax=Penicillium lagena TaxID=94218 RepID=UPI0025421629|nr:uncharacterized protein N7510_005190 [Penicillium lagena]KAJ5611996.1 hypothetical protein N7510_005190 [Penicillium lagena]